MNLRDDIKQLKTDTATLRKFGFVVGGVFVALGLFFLWRHPSRTPYFIWPGGVLMAAGVVLPRALKWIYLAWMCVAVLLGFIVSHVLLAVFFYLVMFPIGLLARIAGKDFLSLKLDREAKSYWLKRADAPKSAADYEKQF
jgi:hypothetical protein